MTDQPEVQCGFCGGGHISYCCTSAEAETPVTIDVTVGITLPAAAIWPDGDAPEDWTAFDVIKVIEEAGSLQQWVRDWSISEGANVVVSPVGKPSGSGLVW